MNNNKNTAPGSAARMKFAREHFKLSQGEFAESMGFQKSYFSAMEKGDRNISHSVLVSLATVYNISPTWVLLGQGAMFLNDVDNIKTTAEMEPPLKKLIWYCENSQYVKHSVMGHFLRILRRDKDIIEDDINMERSSRESEQIGINKMDKEELYHDKNHSNHQENTKKRNSKKTNSL